MAGEKIDFNALLNLANCAKCQKPIVGKMLRTMGKTWHDTCFVCAACNKSLGGGYEMDESKKPEDPELPQHKPHCPECYARLFMPTCKGCSKNIAEQSYVQGCGGAWHEACFVCAKCRQPLTQGTQHWPVDNEPYCQKGYWEAKMQFQAESGVQQSTTKSGKKAMVNAPQTPKSKSAVKSTP